MEGEDRGCWSEERVKGGERERKAVSAPACGGGCKKV